MSANAKCHRCGQTFDIGHAEVTQRYADCDVFKAPCCGSPCDTRGKWGGPSWARMGYDDMTAYRNETGKEYPLSRWSRFGGQR